MMTLFNRYKDSNRITEALLVGRNLFNKNPSCQEVFEPYFDLLCTLADNLPLLSDRQNFAGQAGVALAFFSENAELNEEVVDSIGAYEQRINSISSAIGEAEQEQAQRRAAEIVENNNTQLKQVYKLKDSLRVAATREQFEKVLADLAAIDRRIDKDMLTEEQSARYDTLTKECTEGISEKLRELEHQDNVSYNRQAVDAYTKAFEEFRKDEAKYKNQTQLAGLTASTLFAYDASRLFNETLIYYNHVYSYIFNKLDEDGKFALTRFSIDCERKLRL